MHPVPVSYLDFHLNMSWCGQGTWFRTSGKWTAGPGRSNQTHHFDSVFTYIGMPWHLGHNLWQQPSPDTAPGAAHCTYQSTCPHCADCYKSNVKPSQALTNTSTYFNTNHWQSLLITEYIWIYLVGKFAEENGREQIVFQVCCSNLLTPGIFIPAVCISIHKNPRKSLNSHCNALWKTRLNISNHDFRATVMKPHYVYHNNLKFTQWCGIQYAIHLVCHPITHVAWRLPTHHRPLTWSQLKCQLPRVWWDCAHGRWPGLLKNMLTCADCLWWHQITCDIMWSHARDGDVARVHRPQVLRWWSQQNGCVWKWDTSHPPRGLSIFYLILLYDKLINKWIFELVPHFFWSLNFKHHVRLVLYSFIIVQTHAHTHIKNIYGGCPKYLFPDSPQSLSQSRSNRGTTVSNRGRVCSSLIRSFT